MSEKEVTRRKILSAVGGVAAGYATAQYVRADDSGPVLGPVGGNDTTITIMPGQVKETYYYGTIEQFEDEEGEPNTFPALVFTDAGVFAYDD